MNLGVTQATVVLGRAGRRDQRGIHHGAGLEHQAALDELGVDGGQNLLAQTVLFEQVSKAQDGALVRQTGDARIQVGKLALQRDIVQGFFHGRFGMPEELLKQMNAQHYLNGKRRPAGLSCRRMRPNQRQQLRPWNYQIISSNNSRFRVRMVTSPNPMVARLICSMDQLSQIRP